MTGVKHYLTLLGLVTLSVLTLLTTSPAYAQDAPPITRYLDAPLPAAQAPADPAQRQAESPADILPWSLLAYQSLQNRDNWDIYLLDHTQDPRQFITDAADDIEPRLNRGATQLIFSSNRTGNYEIYRVQIDGSNLTQLTDLGQDSRNAAWSFDGTRIVFASRIEDQYDLFVMNADGSDLQRLTDTPNDEVHPHWSPDGSQLAFVAVIDGIPRIAVADAAGTVRALTQHVSIRPIWSPDGQRIAFAADSDLDGWFELWVFSPETGEQRLSVPQQLPSDVLPQSWSPDASAVAYTTINYIQQNNQWYWTSATIGAAGVSVPINYNLVNTPTVWYPDWQTLDAIAPTSSIKPLPALSPTPFKIEWIREDVGGAGLAAYEFQFRSGDDPEWKPWVVDNSQSFTDWSGTGGQRFSFRGRARDAAFNWEPWPAEPEGITTIENLPPRSQMGPLPKYTRYPLVILSWTGQDPGESGVESFDVQMRRLPDDTWTDIQAATDWTGMWFDGEPGNTYNFRVRARDRAGNLENWPDEGSVTTFYSWAVTGHVVDNGGAPMQGVNVSSQPTYFQLERDGEGSVTAYHALAASAPVNVTWQKDGYGALPATRFITDQDETRAVVLPPADNLIANSHFEEGTLGPAWMTAGNLPPTPTTQHVRSGEDSVLLGCPTFSPATAVGSADESASQLQMAVGPDNVAHLIWVSYGNGTTGAINYSRQPPGEEWQAALRLSPETHLAEAPQIAVDSAGVIHVIWATMTDGVRGIYYISRHPSEEWSTPKRISSPEKAVWDLRLAIDSNDGVHVLWLESDMVIQPFYTRLQSSGEWTLPVSLTASESTTMSPVLLAGADGTVHAAWLEHVGSEFDVLYRRQDGSGNWGAIENLSQTPSNSAPFFLRIAKDGRLHVVWTEQTIEPNAIFSTFWYRTQDAQGQWLAPEEIARRNHYGDSVSGFALGKGDTVVVVVQNSESGLFAYTERKGEQWSPLQTMATQPAFRAAAIAADGQGAIHVMWIDISTGWARDLHYRQRHVDGSWQPVQRLTQSSPISFPPQLVIGPQDGLYAAWLVDDGMLENPSAQPHALHTLISPGGGSTLSQVVEIPAEIQTPMLSFQFLTPSIGWDESAFTVTVGDTLTETTVFSVTQDSGTWQHASVNLSKWRGQPITLTLGLQQQADRRCAAVYLDEVTLGTAYPDLWLSGAGSESAAPGETVQFTLLVGNQGSAAAEADLTVNLPAAIRFEAATPIPAIDGQTLRWQLGELTTRSRPVLVTITGTVDLRATPLSGVQWTAEIEAESAELETANNQISASTFIGYRLHLPLVKRETE